MKEVKPYSIVTLFDKVSGEYMVRLQDSDGDTIRVVANMSPLSMFNNLFIDVVKVDNFKFIDNGIEVNEVFYFHDGDLMVTCDAGDGESVTYSLREEIYNNKDLMSLVFNLPFSDFVLKGSN